MLQGRILLFLSPFLLINLTYSFPQEESPRTLMAQAYDYLGEVLGHSVQHGVPRGPL